MYAIIEEGGGQRKVTADQEVLIDLVSEGEGDAKQPVEAGKTLTFDRVLLAGDEGKPAKIGAPYVDGASVTAEVVEPVVLGQKLFIYKFKPKKGYRRKTGHRQRYTKVKITKINA